MASSPFVANQLNNLAQLLKATNRLADAEPLMRRALANLLLFHLQTGHHHPHENLFRGNYATFLQQMGQSEEQIQQAFAAIVEEARVIVASE